MTRIVIGIDPGLTGAVAKLKYVIERVTPAEEVVDMPAMSLGEAKGSVKSQVNPAGLAEILRNMTDGERDETMVVIERIDGYIDNKASIFSMGNSYGCVRGVVATLGLPLQIVRPQDWKQHYGLKKDKEASRRRAIELYPAASLSRKKDHNRAEALLLARYGWEVLR